jgi:patatin-like phospholipase/acyl hydrolase
MSNRFQILSLDGGGIKGLFSAAILAFLEEDLEIKIVDHFDLIVGTSTGGLIALGLGASLAPKDIIKLFVTEGPNIFPSSPLLSLKRYMCRKFSAGPIEKTLKAYFEEKRLSDSIVPLVIPSYNIDEDHVYLFKTPHHERLKRDWRVPLWKVGMATAAAPTYFPSFFRVDHIRLIDGGVWANNPTMVGITEAISLFGKRLESIKVFNIGTTDEIKGRPTKLNHGGLWQWRNDAVEVVLRGQSIGTHTQAAHLLGEDNILRLDPPVPNGLFKMDKLSKPELLSKAAHLSRHLSPKFKDMFADHRAAKYQPLYQ